MKKIIITGGLGYIGMELAKLYSAKSRIYDITVIDNKFFSDRVSQLKRWNIKFKQIDILDQSSLKNEICDADLIYHLAGITDVGSTKEDIDKARDKKVNDVGIKGTKNIIKFSSKNSKIIFTSTHVVFEGARSTLKGIDENHETLPVLEYSKGKAQSENDLIKSERDYVIENIGKLVVKPANASGGYGIMIGPKAPKKEREEVIAKIKKNPREYIAQPLETLSTAPTITEDDIEPRHLDLRPFVLSGKTTYVSTGGLTRVALRKGSTIVNSSQGGGSKDTLIVET